MTDCTAENGNAMKIDTQYKVKNPIIKFKKAKENNLEYYFRIGK